MEPFIIHTERLLIRNLHPGGLEDFHVYRSNPDVAKYQNFHPAGFYTTELWSKGRLLTVKKLVITGN